MAALHRQAAHRVLQINTFAGLLQGDDTSNMDPLRKGIARLILGQLAKGNGGPVKGVDGLLLVDHQIRELGDINFDSDQLAQGTVMSFRSRTAHKDFRPQQLLQLEVAGRDHISQVAIPASNQIKCEMGTVLAGLADDAGLSSAPDISSSTETGLARGNAATPISRTAGAVIVGA